MKWDIFISYASEDKYFVLNLANLLRDAGLSIWFDEFELEAGDGLRRSIDQGLKESRYGIVILSPDFFRKEWTQKELDGLTARDDGKSKVIIPVWYEVTAEEVREYSPMLADKLSIYFSGSIEGVIAKILRAIEKDRFLEKGWLPSFLSIEMDTQLTVLPFRPVGNCCLCIGRFPVTNGQFEIFVNETKRDIPVGERYKDGMWQGPFVPWNDVNFSDEEKPVVCVDFWDAYEYCQWLDRHSGSSIFLPSSYIWDFSAKNGSIQASLEQSLRLSGVKQNLKQDLFPNTIDKKGNRDNDLGVSDMFGGVWEWCVSGSFDSALSFISLPRKLGYVEPEIKGGGYLDDLYYVGLSMRIGMMPDKSRTKHADLGFRVGAFVPIERIPSRLLALLESRPGLPLAEERFLRAQQEGLRRHRDQVYFDGTWF